MGFGATELCPLKTGSGRYVLSRIGVNRGADPAVTHRFVSVYFGVLAPSVALTKPGEHKRFSSAIQSTPIFNLYLK